MNNVVVLLLVMLAIAIIVGGIWYYTKRRYIKSIEERGWTWVESPGIDIIIGLNTAPFGVGFERRVDDQVIGRGPAGVPFQAFRYSSDAFSSSGYVVSMKLPKSLPEASAFLPDMPRAGVSGALVTSSPVHVVARRPDFGREFAAAVIPALGGLRDSQQQAMRVDVGVDHDQLVMLHVPRKPEDLELAVAWLEGVQQALTSSNAMSFDGTPPPQHLSFQDREHWVYRPYDDSMLSYVNHSSGGSNHQAKDIIVSDNQGLPFIRLTHTWETTYTTTDSKGNTTTHTQRHTEHIAQFRTTFPFREVSVNWGLFGGFGGNKVEFESTAFNQRFKVRCPVPRFASDVFHPRQLEYFLRTGGLGFIIEGDGTIRVEGGDWSPAELDRTSEFLHGFFARIPDFAWKELGAWPRPIAEIENYSA
ncbi:hypothetical protein [Tessaracoccus antarcticus]|uniref:DUF3137 domain-containing protein n=1 Tax=Tessaracoccus antarcticus TaxID=2479848 RepID=A0A3M0GER5_9ACTN|nr:hypothetical protein [Tessaracoccus antarcticus]RMB59659.1 hypothetical protein EAX62_07795 [Tessaracoccus antarcticus]